LAADTGGWDAIGIDPEIAGLGGDSGIISSAVDSSSGLSGFETMGVDPEIPGLGGWDAMSADPQIPGLSAEAAGTTPASTQAATNQSFNGGFEAQGADPQIPGLNMTPSGGIKASSF
jgi:hypothetical protein